MLFKRFLDITRLVLVAEGIIHLVDVLGSDLDPSFLIFFRRTFSVDSRLDEGVVIVFREIRGWSFPPWLDNSDARDFE